MRNKGITYLSLIVEANDDGYLSRCPGIRGAFAEGDTVEEAIFNCIDVVKMITSYRRERGESLGIIKTELANEVQMAVSIPIGVG